MASERLREPGRAEPGRPTAAGSRPQRSRVFIVSNVRLYRDGVSVMMARARSIQVVGAADHQGAANAIPALSPEIVLLDASLLRFEPALAAIQAAASASKMIAFALTDVDNQVVACAEAGVAAFLGRNASARDLIAAIEQAQRGEFGASPAVASLLLTRIAEMSRRGFPPASAAATLALTRREREIIPMIERGLSNKEIARTLSIQAATIKNHIHNILDKLQLRRRGEIAAHMRETVRPRQPAAPGRGIELSNRPYG